SRLQRPTDSRPFLCFLRISAASSRRRSSLPGRRSWSASAALSSHSRSKEAARKPEARPPHSNRSAVPYGTKLQSHSWLASHILLVRGSPAKIRYERSPLWNCSLFRAEPQAVARGSRARIVRPSPRVKRGLSRRGALLGVSLASRKRPRNAHAPARGERASAAIASGRSETFFGPMSLLLLILGLVIGAAVAATVL